MKSLSRHFDELMSYCASIPLIDCHDHSTECGPKFTDPYPGPGGPLLPQRPGERII